MLIPTRAETFHAQSFLHVPAIFTPIEVQSLAADLDADGGGERVWRGPWLTPDDKRRGVTLLARHDIHQRSHAWARAVAHPDLLAVVGECLGGRPTLDQTTTVVKPPANGQPFPMHQDSAYYGKGIEDYVIVTVYLDAMTTENGPIQFVPGSHKLGALEHVRDGKAYLPQYSLADSVMVLAQPGDVTLFHIHTVHGSAPNLSPALRRTVRLGYVRG